MGVSTYVINGKTYNVEVGEVRRTRSGELVQSLTINGTEVELRTEPAEDSRGNKIQGKKVVTLHINGNNLDKQEFIDILARRQVSENVTPMEKLAYYEYNYNRYSLAEAAVQHPNESYSEYDHQCLFTNEMINDPSKLPSLQERFPWHYASPTTRARERVGALIGREPDKTNVAYRKALEEADKTRNDLFDRRDIEGTIHDDLLGYSERDALHDDLSIQSNLPNDLALAQATEDNERIDEALHTRKEKSKRNTRGTPIISNDRGGYSA